MIQIDFDRLEGEITFHSDAAINPTLMNLDATLRSLEWEGDITDTEQGGLSVAIHVVITHYESIIGFLRVASASETIEFSTEARELFGFARTLVSSSPRITPELNPDDIKRGLSEFGWNDDQRSLSDFQLRNIVRTTTRDNAAIFSVPGSGKTVEALAYSTFVTEGKCIFVIVCPRNAYVAWEHELQACLDVNEQAILRATGSDGELKADLLLPDDPHMAVLINYNRLWFRHSIISEYIRKCEENGNTVVFIMDESHHFKGGKAFTSGVKRCSTYASHRVILSGTPMPRSPADLVHQFQALIPEDMHTITTDSIEGYSQDIFVRTTKDDLNLLPPVIEIISVPMDEQQDEIYELLTEYYSAELAARGSARAMSELLRLQRIMIYIVMHVSNPSLVNEKFLATLRNVNPELADRIEEYAQGNHGFGPKIRWALNRARVLADEGKKVLIWSNFVDNVSLIADELEDIGTVFIKGDVPVEESWKEGYIALDEGSEEERTREQMIREFKTNDDCMVMVANPAAAGEGISLHDVCHHAIYIDRTFNATQFMQSMDRIHRYGKNSEGQVICQVNPVTIEILVCRDTIDMVVHENLRRKMDRMYEWLRDPSLSSQLSALQPMITEAELSMISSIRDN